MNLASFVLLKSVAGEAYTSSNFANKNHYGFTGDVGLKRAANMPSGHEIKLKNVVAAISTDEHVLGNKVGDGGGLILYERK